MSAAENVVSLLARVRATLGPVRKRALKQTRAGRGLALSPEETWALKCAFEILGILVPPDPEEKAKAE